MSKADHLRRAKRFWDRETSSERRLAEKRKNYVEATAEKTVEEIMPFIESATLILDVGCGSGRIAIPLAQVGRLVVGLDISKNSLLWAREWSKKEKVDLDLVVGVAEALPFKSCFDCLVCLFTVEFTSDPYQVAKEFHRVLKNGGGIVLELVPTIDDHVRGTSYRRFMGEKRVLNDILPWEFNSLLKESGFVITERRASEFLIDVPPEVQEWLGKNPRVGMCVALWRVIATKNPQGT